MKWILIWWVISPGHTQVIHTESGFESESKCQTYAAALQAPVNKVIRWHCSLE